MPAEYVEKLYARSIQMTYYFRWDSEVSKFHLYYWRSYCIEHTFQLSCKFTFRCTTYVVVGDFRRSLHLVVFTFLCNIWHILAFICTTFSLLYLLCCMLYCERESVTVATFLRHRVTFNYIQLFTKCALRCCGWCCEAALIKRTCEQVLKTRPKQIRSSKSTCADSTKTAL